MAAKTYSVSWSYKLRTNRNPTSIREAIADLLLGEPNVPQPCVLLRAEVEIE